MQEVLLFFLVLLAVVRHTEMRLFEIMTEIDAVEMGSSITINCPSTHAPLEHRNRAYRPSEYARIRRVRSPDQEAAEGWSIALEGKRCTAAMRG